MKLSIRKESPIGPEAARLIRLHMEEIANHLPKKSIHTLDVSDLQRSSITFWLASLNSAPVGCGALNELGEKYAELKSMHVLEGHRKHGIGTYILRHIVNEAKYRDYEWLGLETGSVGAFSSARKLYVRAGFRHCGPFASYSHDKNSVFMKLRLR